MLSALSVPDPATLALMGIGLLVLAATLRRWRSRQAKPCNAAAIRREALANRNRGPQ
jgi:PEP-CTERM motif